MSPPYSVTALTLFVLLPLKIQESDSYNEKDTSKILFTIQHPHQPQFVPVTPESTIATPPLLTIEQLAVPLPAVEFCPGAT